MFKIIFLLLFSLNILDAIDIKPSLHFHSVGFVTDFVIEGKYLYASTDRGTIDIFDIDTQKIVHQVSLEPIMAFDGEIVARNISSVDILNGKILFVSQAQDGYRDVWTYENYELKKISKKENRLLIKEARFITKEKILFATFDSDIILYDTKEKFEVYKQHVSFSALKDITLNKLKTQVIMSDESGTIKILNIKDASLQQELNSENVDNVYHVASAKSTIITGGQDRRVAVYQKGKASYHLKSDFFVYCVGISPDATLGIYSRGDESLQVFDIKSKEKKYKLVGHTSLINQIKFINNKELYSSQRGTDILFWKLP